MKALPLELKWLALFYLKLQQSPVSTLESVTSELF